MLKELWKSIKNFPGYQISNKGQIKSWKVTSLNYHVLKPIKTPKGYFRVYLCNTFGQYPKFIHRLVLEAFKGSAPDYYVGNHKDGIKTNNYIDNLEWITKSEDIKHAYETGLRHPYQAIREGEKSPHTKLKDGKVWLIRRLLWFNWSQRKVAKMFRVSLGAISCINLERTWSHIKFNPTNKDRKYYKENLI